MSSQWKVTDNQLLLQRSGTPQPFKHSVRVKEAMLSFRYWDYLAWAVQRQQVKNMLLLGLGGGTVLQLLQRWGTTPTCLAVEIDSTMTNTVKRLGWLDYPDLTIAHEDARQFIKDGSNEEFDAIIVDLYDEYGFVQEVYRPPLLQWLVHLLSPRGVLLVHCLDPAIKYLALNLVLPDHAPSPSYTVANDLEALSMEVEIYPLWTSALVLARQKNAHFDFRLKERPGIQAMPVELQWLSKFLTTRQQTVQNLSAQLTCLLNDYTYDVLEQLDDNYMYMLVRSAPSGLRETLSKAVRVREKTSTSPPGLIWERHKDGLTPLAASTIQGSLAFSRLLEMNPGHGLEVEQLIETVSQVAHLPSSNFAFKYMESFALAWGGHWDEAMHVLGES